MKDTLIASLQTAREHILGALDGLDPSDLHRAVLPSGWTALGLVNHLTVDVERFWFSAVVRGDPATIASFETESDAWQIPHDADGEAILTAYRTECERADAVLATADLDAAPAWWPQDLFGDFRLDTVGEVLLHVIVETTCHAGHLDAARELIDGRQWIVLT